MTKMLWVMWSALESNAGHALAEIGFGLLGVWAIWALYATMRDALHHAPTRRRHKGGWR